MRTVQLMYSRIEAGAFQPDATISGRMVAPRAAAASASTSIEPVASSSDDSTNTDADDDADARDGDDESDDDALCPDDCYTTDVQKNRRGAW